MKTLFIVCVFTLLFITLLIFNKILIFKNKFGTITTNETECVPNSKYCIDGGKKITTTHCTPNANTKYGCLDENNNQFFSTKYAVSSACKPACKENIIEVQEITDCVYPGSDIQNNCTKYNSGTRNIIKKCQHIDDSGISICSESDVIPVTTENCTVTENILPTCGYYYYESNGEKITCSGANSIDDPVIVTDDTCFTDTSYQTKMDNMMYYGMEGFINPNSVFKCSNNSCIPSEISLCQKKCVYEGGADPNFPLIADLQENIFNFWITSNNDLINDTNLLDQEKSYLLVAQTQACPVNSYPIGTTPEQTDEFRRDFYIFPDPENHTEIYGQCNSPSGEIIDFSEVRYINLYPDGHQTFDICGRIGSCGNEGEILKSNIFQYNNGLLFTIIPMSIDPSQSSATSIRGNFCIIAHSFGQTYALTYSHKYTDHDHIRLKIVPIDKDNFHERQLYTMYGIYTKDSDNMYFTIITHQNAKYFILNKYDKELTHYIKTKYEDNLQFKLIKLDKNNHMITTNGNFCNSLLNIMLTNPVGDYDSTC